YHAAGKLVAATDPRASPPTVTLKPAPESSDNVALVSFSAHRDERDVSRLQVFARALNFRDKRVDTKVELEVFVNGARNKILERPLALAARQVVTEPGKDESFVTPGEGAVVFDLSDVDERADVVMHAKLLDVNDKFPLDDEAWLVVGIVQKAR